MPDNIIQIKRSSNTASPSELFAGELAYSYVSNNLYIGTESNTVIKIAGGRDVELLDVTPGVLTNSAALVANSTGYIDQLKTLDFVANTIQTNSLSVVNTITGLTLANATIESLLSPLETKDGGTGLTSFTSKGVFYASNTSTMSQVVGANGQVLQINNDTPSFGDLDGGTF